MNVPRIWTDNTMAVITEADPYRSPDGTLYPATWDKSLIPGLIEVVTTDPPEGDGIQVSATQAQAVLDAARKAACNNIDRQAEAVRGRYLTPGAGQAMVYQQKVAEARDHQAGGAGPWPHLTAEVGITAEDETGVAAVILATEAAWLDISAWIEKVRLKAKRDIATANLDQIAEIVAAFAAAFPSI